jgi:tRNA pseudouridine32 synthase/23S rRNA pseudouridine746 synthase
MYDLIHQERDFLVIEKHSGVSFHREGATAGLAATVRDELGERELYTVHRLDRITSGLMLFAKSRDTAAALGRLFHEGAVEKYYLAVSDRLPEKKQGMIKGDMERSRRGTWKLTRRYSNPAITRFFSCSLGRGLRLFVVRPVTGKTHQVRVALKSIGSPVLGDPLYHHSRGNEESDRAYLHAYAIRFTLNGRQHVYVLPPGEGRYFTDDAFTRALVNYERPWELTWHSH